MPNNTHKSAAVPFVNQKGERSMKRVKVERYVAGKKPSYAKDEDEEYYTTDDEEEGGSEESCEEESDVDQDNEAARGDHKPDQKPGTTGYKRKTAQQDNEGLDLDKREPKQESSPLILDDQDEDDEDPRFRRLKQLETKPSTSRLLAVQTTSRNIQKVEDRIIIDEDEDEEEIRQRHALARARTLEEPLGPLAILGDFSDQQIEGMQTDSDTRPAKKEQTEDILKDHKLAGIKPKKKEKDDSKMAEKFKEIIEQARQEAIIKAQLDKKIEEDIKRELEREALSKNDIGTHELEMVKTDDEDEELAYEEWKLREIKRVQRDRSERLLETKAR